MSKKVTDGKALELHVAEAYRRMGAWQVKHDIELAGNQIDVYVELETPGRLLHRIVVEVKDWSSPVGIRVVNQFGQIVKLLHSERLVDEGVVVSAAGFSRQARRAAEMYGIRLLELADLDALAAEAGHASLTRRALLSVPSPPHPYFAHPYALQENFTGRVHERQMLTEWLSREQEPLLALVAIGGMGKSALAWAWVQRDVLDLPLPGLIGDLPQEVQRCNVPEADRPEGVLWWSFYERDAGFPVFVDRALAYVGGGRSDPREIPTVHDKVRALVDLLEKRCFLVILDGLERQLRAYANLSAIYQGDAVSEDSRSAYRACTDPHVANFLRWTAALAMRSRVLITSRLVPRELDGLAGCRREDLSALDPEDAVTFFRAQGVKGTRAEIQAACQPYGYHPLALRLLTGMILRDPARPGDVAAAAEYSPLPELVSREHHILGLAYGVLSPPLRELLGRLAAFRSPVAYEVAALLSPLEGKRALGLAFQELADRGLIYFDQERWRYDMHPIVRAYAYNRLVDKEGVHNRLRDYFASRFISDARSGSEMAEVNSVEDLAPIIELYHHTVHAGRYDEAFQLFHDRLSDLLYYRFGAYQTEIELLRALFPSGGSHAAWQWAEAIAESGEIALPRLQEPGAQAWTLNALASSYSCSGQLRSAVQLLELHNALQEELEDRTNLVIGLENLASVQLELGQLAAAQHNLRQVIEWARTDGDTSLEVSGHQELGRLLTYQSAFEEAGRELDTATALQLELSPTPSDGLGWTYRAQRALLMGQPAFVLDAAQAALEQAREASDWRRHIYPIRNLVWAHWLLGSAHLALGHPVEAENHLGDALNRCRHINLVELEPDILLTWALWHRAIGNREQAWQRAVEALSIADRCEYRLKQAEIHNFLARWELDGGDTVKAHDHAVIAKERAWCDGPPHCHRLALDQALQLLEETGG